MRSWCPTRECSASSPAPGDWTVRIIAGGGVTRDVQVSAKLGEVSELAVAV
ncbi:DUF1416 domain-containing protein [Nonomuraea ferruginea]